MSINDSLLCLNIGLYKCCKNCTTYTNTNCPFYSNKLMRINTLIEIYQNFSPIKNNTP